MIKEIPAQEDIYIPNDYEIFVVTRIEKLGRQKEHHRGCLSCTNDEKEYLVYTSPDQAAFRYKAGWAKKIFSLVDRVYERDMTDCGLNSLEWEEDWKDLMAGKVKPLELEAEGKCPSGHQMKRMPHHWYCPLDESFKWDEK